MTAGIDVRTLFKTGSIKTPYIVPKGKKLSNNHYGGMWERNVAEAFAQYCSTHGGYTHHMIQPRQGGRVSGKQVVDIMLDNIDGEYFAIECKFRSSPAVHIRRLFIRQTDQFATERQFCKEAARYGILCLLMPTSANPEDCELKPYGIPFVTCNMLNFTVSTSYLDTLCVHGYAVSLGTYDKNGLHMPELAVSDLVHMCVYLHRATIDMSSIGKPRVRRSIRY